MVKVLALVAVAGLWQALWMRRWIAPALVVLAVGLLAGAASAEARSSGRTSFRDKTAGVQIFLPATWKRQTRSAFPGVLATFGHTTHAARFVLAVQRRDAVDTPRSLADKNAALLKKRGWRVGAITATRLGRLPAAAFIATDPKSKLQVRQLYAVREEFAYVITLVAPPAQSARLHADFLFVQKSARFAR